MKKLKIFILFILVSTVVYAVSFSNKEEALSAARDLKQDLNQDVNSAIATAKFKTDKECFIDPLTEVVECRICYNYAYEGVIYDNCIFPQEDSTKEEDIATIQEQIEQEIFSKAQEIKYIETELKDTKLTGAIK